MRLLRTLLGALLALLILFEEWGWDLLQTAAARLARWPPLAALERRISRLPPYAALAVLLLPALTLLPLKLLGIWLLARGQVLWSLALVVASKVLGTAVVAHLFALTRPALMRLGWFARGYARWAAWKAELLAWVRASAAWRAAASVRQRAARWLSRWRG
jgi:hypothetical protein